MVTRFEIYIYDMIWNEITAGKRRSLISATRHLNLIIPYKIPGSLFFFSLFFFEGNPTFPKGLKSVVELNNNFEGIGAASSIQMMKPVSDPCGQDRNKGARASLPYCGGGAAH